MELGWVSLFVVGVDLVDGGFDDLIFSGFIEDFMYEVMLLDDFFVF